MKVIAIFDMPDGVDPKKYYVKYILALAKDDVPLAEVGYQQYDLPLRQLPQIKEETGKTIQDISFAVGWNACLEEILDETV